ncbi:MAG: amidohydrolase family protein [Acidobacteria bacterium]|nr:amidohydrolase family protein [Acidobacteriota bacterium]
MTFDLILSGGQLLDGTGTPAVDADLGVIGEKIEAVGDLSRAQARRVIPLQGLTVAPGFIDSHTHSEGALLHDPRHAYGLRQGITTEIVGLDGMSWAPLSRPNFQLYARYLGGILGDPPPDLDMSSVAAFRAHYHRKVAVNVAYLVPHGALRLELLGFRDLPLRGETLRTAGRMVRQGIEQGAVGFSTGAAYYPGYWADTRELVGLCGAVREAGGVYVNEPRVGTPGRAFAGDGIQEGLEIARQSGAPVHFAHLRTTEQTAGRLQELTDPIDRAKDQGVDCTMDIYPYPSGSSIAVSFLPGEMQEGGPDAILQRLADPGRQRALRDHLENHLFAPLEPVTFSYLPRNPYLEGKSLAEASRLRGTSPAQTLCDLLLEEELKVGYLNAPPSSRALWEAIDRDCLQLLARPDAMACSDITPLGSAPHPRCYGAFPRFLGRLRRRHPTLRLETMVQRMTDGPARRFGLTRRGRLQRGYFADLVAFDPDTVTDTATYDDPRRFPVGIPWVMVNGQVAVEEGRCTGVLAGQAVP